METTKKRPAFSLQSSATIVASVGFFLLLITCHLLFITQVDAASNNISNQIGIGQPTENAGVIVGNSTADTLLGGVTRNAITLVFTIASISTVFMFLWGSVDWILSGGDKEKIASARKKIIASLVGLVLLATSFLIISLIGVFIGINPIKGLQIPALGGNINQTKNSSGGSK